MRPRPKAHRRGQTLPGDTISREELESRRAQMDERLQRILRTLAEKQAGQARR